MGIDVVYSDEVADQIQYAIVTRNIYNLCGVTSAGFCEGVTPLFQLVIIILVLQYFHFQVTPTAYSSAASFFANDDCIDYYRTLGLRSNATAVNASATAICAGQNCRNRMDSYRNFLITCRVGSIDGDDDDDDDVCHNCTFVSMGHKYH